MNIFDKVCLISRKFVTLLILYTVCLLPFNVSLISLAEGVNFPCPPECMPLSSPPPLAIHPLDLRCVCCLPISLAEFVSPSPTQGPLASIILIYIGKGCMSPLPCPSECVIPSPVPLRVSPLPCPSEFAPPPLSLYSGISTLSL